MPTLQFKGKNIIWNHHLAVPFHTLDEVPELNYNPEKANGNMIIEGDNLIALKALLPQFAGKVKCIYIDPPYNTGNDNGENKGWIYNDNVNSPLLKDWFKTEVNRDDLSRHDKWLCMMVPRLKLLRELLSDDGAIFVSLDDNELHNFRRIMDEIFGEENFKNIVIIRRGIKSVQAQFETVDKLNYGFEYLVIYTRNPKFRFKKFEIELENGKEGSWNNHWRGTDRPTMRYEIFGITPETGQWRWGKERSLVAIENYNEMLEELNISDEDITQEQIDTWYKNKCEESGEELDLLRLSNNGKPEHFIAPSESKLASNLWSDLKPNGSSQLKAIFKKKVFNNPKSVDLIKRVIKFIEGDEENITVLDSFAGSGTTMHAVMELNKEDGGNRKCVMVQMPENSEAEPDKNICKDITRERVKRAIDKYGYDSGFKYYRLGIPLDAETMLAGQLPTYNQFAKYVYYLCTGENLEAENKIKEKDFYVGEYGKQAIYLVYKQDYETLTRLALNLTLAEKIKEQQPGKKRIVYAPSCFLDEEYLTDNQIEYVGIPYNLFQRNQ
ncbi:MAG: site-specific DNA-methyltransferase [Bacteroidales bacterium]|jgi:adenine-specific DNA-methyltransferase|nr:site-specific DNA-methyltransferase [Bacteroidales bacterium]